ncbi:MAG: hypothetical protein WC809_21060 [Sinimarinibacterium sp.]|jgi:hypothetical protein
MHSSQKADIVRLLNEMPGSFANLPGEIFSSGLSALTPGDFYLAGLNPMAGSRYPTLRDHIADWRLDSFSAFLHQCWNKTCWNVDCYGLQHSLQCTHERGTDRHQMAVRRLMERARPGFDLARLFATNAVFARSASASSFQKENGLSMAQAFDVCWPLHKYFLSIVRPSIILCLGYQQGGSAYSLFSRKAAGGLVTPVSSFTAGRKFPSFKSTEMTFDINGGRLSCLIVGIRHPSYVPDAADTSEFAELVTRHLRAEQ